MWNKINKETILDYMSEPVDSDNFQVFWKNILWDYSSDYWKMARGTGWKFDTIGYQLRGNIISCSTDCYRIFKVETIVIEETIGIEFQDFIKIHYQSQYGKYICIPIEWFEDREQYKNKWYEIAKDEYIRMLKSSIDFNQQQIESYKKELEKFE